MLLAFFKPFDVLSQFTMEQAGQRTLAEFGFPPGVYPIGRLDRDSEGLLLLSDEAEWTSRLLHPARAHPREYHVQVEGMVTPEALRRLSEGVIIQGRRTRPARAAAIAPPQWPARHPPIRFRKTVPDSWLSLELVEGRNRQVRRMTAAVEFPTLRLVRVRMGRLALDSLSLEPGQWKELTREEREAVLDH